MKRCKKLKTSDYQADKLIPGTAAIILPHSLHPRHKKFWAVTMVDTVDPFPAERGTGVPGGALGERRWLLGAERRTAPGVICSSGANYGTTELGIHQEFKAKLSGTPVLSVFLWLRGSPRNPQPRQGLLSPALPAIPSPQYPPLYASKTFSYLNSPFFFGFSPSGVTPFMASSNRLRASFWASFILSGTCTTKVTK